MNAIGATKQTSINIDVQGGMLSVAFTKVGNHFTNVFLTGPATFVFEGTIAI